MLQTWSVIWKKGKRGCDIFFKIPNIRREGEFHHISRNEFAQYMWDSIEFYGFAKCMTGNESVLDCPARGGCIFHKEPDRESHVQLTKLFPKFDMKKKWDSRPHCVCLIKFTEVHDGPHILISEGKAQWIKHFWKGTPGGVLGSPHKKQITECKLVVFSIYFCLFLL